MKQIHIARFNVADLGLDRIVSSGKFEYEFRKDVSAEVFEERKKFEMLILFGFRCEKEDILYFQSKKGNTDVIFCADIKYVDDAFYFDSAFAEDRKNIEFIYHPSFFELAVRTRNISKKTLENFCKPHLLNLDVDVMHQNLSRAQVVKRKEHKGHTLLQTYTLFSSGFFSSQYNLYTVITDLPEELLKLEQKLYARKAYFDDLEIRLESLVR